LFNIIITVDRDGRISGMRQEGRDLIGQRGKLQKQERVLRIRYDQVQLIG